MMSKSQVPGSGRIRMGGARVFSLVSLDGRSIPGSRDAAASPQFPETPRPWVLCLPPGSGSGERGAGGEAPGCLEGPGEKAALCSPAAACTSGAPARRGVRVARASGGTCAGGAHGGGSTTGQRQKSERPSSCAQWRQLRHRWQPGAPRHKGWLWDVAATREPAKGKRKPRARPVTV